MAPFQFSGEVLHHDASDPVDFCDHVSLVLWPVRVVILTIWTLLKVTGPKSQFRLYSSMAKTADWKSFPAGFRKLVSENSDD